jgi:hypothetical protein
MKTDDLETLTAPQLIPIIVELLEKIEDLERDSRKLDALEAYGVDNWVGYDAAMDAFRSGD